MVVGEKHAEAVFAEPVALDAGIEQKPFEVGGNVAVLLDLNDDKSVGGGIAACEEVMEGDARVDGDALAFLPVDECDALEGVLQPRLQLLAGYPYFLGQESAFLLSVVQRAKALHGNLNALFLVLPVLILFLTSKKQASEST